MKKLFGIVFDWLGPFALFIANIAVSENRLRFTVVFALVSLLVLIASLLISSFVCVIVLWFMHIDPMEDPFRFHAIAPVLLKRISAVIRWLFFGAALAVQLNVAPF